MCGILGSLNLKFTESDLDIICHRGPDSGAIESIELENDSILLAHRRLAIIDLSITGAQPMFDEDKQYAIIFNGEIYNHLDLREKLNRNNFKGSSDTETILYYLIENGIDGIQDFNGIFSFGFLDIQKQKLYLVRDPFGVKPLYYYQKSDKLLFSSEIRPIKKRINTSVNKKAFPELLKLRYNPSPETLYQEVKKVRPGHYLDYDIKKHQYKVTSYGKNVQINTNISFHKAVDRYGQLFENAVKRQLLADVEVGALLSGGIDSALVTYFAQKHTPKPLKTFTVGFKDRDLSNETLEASESANFLKTNHQNISISEANFKEILEETCRIVEEPLGTTSILPMYYLNKEVAKKVKVVLTGQGADEPLGGYNRYRGELLSQKLPSWFFKTAKPVAAWSKKENWIRATQALSEKATVKRFEKIYALFTSDEIKKLIHFDNNEALNKINYFYELTKVKDLDSVSSMMRIDTMMNLADDLLMYTDKVSMNFSVETRVPILDLELVDFLNSLPSHFKIDRQNTKIIHKKFAEEVLPKEIINRPKKGFKSPTEKWFRGDLGQFYKELIFQDESDFSNYFNKDEVLNIFEQHQKGFNKEKQIFLLLSIYYWFSNK